jgi:hypothetical protein
MTRDDPASDLHDIRAELQRENSKNEETHEPSSEDRDKKMGEVHFECGRCQDNRFERSWRRQHRRKHQRPELMLVERSMDFLVPFWRKSLSQKNFAARVPDDVDHDAADSRSGRGKQHVDEKTVRISVNVSGHNRVHGKSHKSGVHRGDGEDTPDAQGREKSPDPLAVGADDVFDRFQEKLVYVRAAGRRAIRVRSSPRANREHAEADQAQTRAHPRRLPGCRED